MPMKELGPLYDELPAGPPSYAGGKARAINNSGQIVDARGVVGLPTRATLWEGDDIRELGTAICDFALARYRPDGSLDPTPDHDGIVVTAVSHDDDAIGAVAIQPSGRIVAGGSAVVGASYDFALSRYEKDGFLDVSFGDDGVTTTDFFGLDDSAPGLAVLPGGKVIVGGSAVSPVTRSDFALARYSKDGSLDPTFDGNGTTGHRLLRTE
jgi:uncharacterized delta-60 repeat protein